MGELIGGNDRGPLEGREKRETPPSLLNLVDLLSPQSRYWRGPEILGPGLVSCKGYGLGGNNSHSNSRHMGEDGSSEDKEGVLIL